MISAKELQKAYNTLYKCIREYIWDFETVSVLVDLEVETYKTFPDIQLVSKHLKQLEQIVRYTDVYKDDDELKSAFDAFNELVDTDDEVYSALKTFKEVITV